MTFRVGDLITGTERKRYVVTNNQGIMRVEEVWDENIIVVRLLSHETKKDFIGQRFSVESCYFRKIGACLK